MRITASRAFRSPTRPRRIPASPPTLAVTQDGSPNNLSLSAYSATVASAASDGRIAVTTGNGCGWSATTDVSWIQITFGASGAGNGGISYHLLANTTTVPRTGNIHVGALTRSEERRVGKEC